MEFTTFGRDSREMDEFWVRESSPIITIDFPLGVQNCERIPKTRVSRFLLFTSLFRRFRLSRVSKSIDLDETYRLVSKMFNFMPCGSVLSKSSTNRRQIDGSPNGSPDGSTGSAPVDIHSGNGKARDHYYPQHSVGRY